MKVNIAISSCPNDTFIFAALANKEITSEMLSFDFTIADIEQLNHMALQKNMHVCKISFGILHKIIEKYAVLNTGNALGFGNGPIFVSKKKLNQNDLDSIRVAVPGKTTTAYFLLTKFFPTIKNTEELLFSDIEDAIISEKFDAGVLIHENRFTYQQKGLIKHADLGELWEKNTQLPLPLGGIVVNRSLPFVIQNEINSLIYKSIIFAKQNTNLVMPFIKKYAQNIQEKVIKQHIDLFVNDYTLSLSNTGKKAILTFLNQHVNKGNSNFSIEEIFINRQ